MKTKYKYTFIILTYVLIIFYPKTAYAMSPDEIQAMPIDKSLNTEYLMSPKTYWITHPDQYDAYALYQKYQYSGNTGIFNTIIEPSSYPISLNSSHSDDNIPNSVFYKSKISWYAWKKYTNEYDCYDRYRKSLVKSFSMRTEFKKDLKKLFFSKRN